MAKICTHCRTKVRTEVERCPSCGATEFWYKCSNCGKVFDTPFCPVCGLKAGEQQKTCPRCGKQYFSASCPDCGWNPAVADITRAAVPPIQYQQPTQSQYAQQQYAQPYSQQQPMYTPQTVRTRKQPKPIYKRWWVWVIASIFLIGMLGNALGGQEAENASASNTQKTTEDNEVVANSKVPETPAEPTEAAKKYLTFGDVIEFDGFEITFLPDINFSEVDNQFSDDNGKPVIVLPVSITNKSGETGILNMFYYTFFTPAGTEANNASAYFMEDDIMFAGEMRDGATLNSNFHIVYEGDGDYYVEFDKILEDVEVKLPIAK